MHFGFDKIKNDLEKLLNYDWVHSEDEGFHWIEEEKVAPMDVYFMSQANKFLGFNFHPTGSQHEPAYAVGGKQEENAPVSSMDIIFTKMIGQIRGGQSNLQDAASGMTLNIFFQKLYADARLPAVEKPWEFGYGNGSFNVYKYPGNNVENLLLLHIFNVVNGQAPGNAEFSRGLLKVKDSLNTQKILADNHRQLLEAACLCARTPPKDAKKIEKELQANFVQSKTGGAYPYKV